MEGQFTEKDSIRPAEAARQNITGEIGREPGAECLTVCPILTAGALANPNYERGGVACLREACAFWDLDSPEGQRDCLIYRAGFEAAVSTDYLKEMRNLLKRNL
jgi:hypothetical protein